MLGVVLEGLLFGLGLALSLGPIFFALTQTSIQKGVIPGLTVGLGIWISDFLFIAIFYKFINQLSSEIAGGRAQFWLGISGAVVMIVFGLVMIFKKPSIEFKTEKFSFKSYLGYWLKGFLINTVNPFTFVFWSGVISTYVIGRGLSSEAHMVLFSTILTVIILSDVGKVFLADLLKQGLKQKHINYIGNFSGTVLMAFGIFLGYQVI